MARFIYLLRGGNEELRQYSPQELQDLLERYDKWVETMKNQDKLLAAHKLKDGVGRRLAFSQDGVVDGPFAETKETIGGFFMVACETLDEAIAMAKTCPIYGHGGEVEVRQVQDDACRYST